MNIERLSDKIENAYNPENDISTPQVSWVDMSLLEIIQAQQKQIEKLEKQIKDIDIVLRRNLSA